MDFDKSRVYTVFNANELKEGNKVIVADTLEELKDNVANNYRRATIKKIANEGYKDRFLTKESSFNWNLAYLIEEPKVTYYRSYINGNEAFKRLAGVNWLVHKVTGQKVRIIAINEDHITLNGTEYSFKELLKDWEIYNFSGENLSCGVLVK